MPNSDYNYAMTISFLLHGGRLRLVDARNDAYFTELTKDLLDGDEVLFIGFARRNEAERTETYEREKSFILARTNRPYVLLMQRTTP